MKEDRNMKPDEAETIGDTVDENVIRLNKGMDSFMISAKHPYAIKFFRSELGIKEEKIRHILSGYYYIVHPFSSFNTGYSIYQLILYMVSIYYGPFEATFIRRADYTIPLTTFALSLDILTYLNTLMIFFMGYVESTGEIVLEPKRIAKRYLRTFFIFDLLGSTPFIIGYKVFDYAYIRGILTIFLMTKMIRLLTIIQLARELRIVLGIKSGRVSVFIGIILVIFIINHFFVCCYLLNFRILERFKMVEPYWLEKKPFWKWPHFKQYMQTIFYACQFMMSNLGRTPHTEAVYLMVIITHLAGKLLMAIICVYLLNFFLNQSSPKIFYVSKMNQLEEFMKRKQIPEDLQEKMKMFYRYRFGKIGFDERDIRRCISSNLKRQIDKKFKMTMIKSIPLMHLVNRKTLRDLLVHATFETYCPQSIIYQFGDPVDCLYILHSGTVAIYSIYGQELTHLTDGAYFGEIGLLSKQTVRTVTVQALEFCEVLTLPRRYFFRMMKSNKRVANMIKRIAKQRSKKFKDLRRRASQFFSPVHSLTLSL